MYSRTANLSMLLPILSLLVCTALARHAHRRPMHMHGARKVSTIDTSSTAASTVAVAALPSITAGNAVIEDIIKIQSGLSELPEDLLSFILALEQRLKEVENLLSDYVDGSNTDPTSPVGPVGPVLSPAPPAVTQDASETTTFETTSTQFSGSATSSLCRPLGGAGPLRPCDQPDATAFTTTRTTRITRTMTSKSTVTQTLSRPTASSGNSTFPAINGTDFTAPAPWTEPYIRTATTSQSAPPTASHTTPTASTLPSTSPEYFFDADSEDNVAVYYGNTNATAEGGLLTLCNNPNVDIVILSYLFTFLDGQPYPNLNSGFGCTGPNPTGLQDCTALAPEVTACQALDKKVLLSLASWNSNTSEASAPEHASALWNLFGAGTEADADLRPFGANVSVDGFDLDIESHDGAFSSAFASELRSLFTNATGKTYYLSASPQCSTIEDTSLGTLQETDFVWVRFYHNPSCDLDSPGFRESFRAWSNLLAESETRGPKLYIGATATSATSGYVRGSGLGSRVRTARGLNVENLGGVMLSDGSQAEGNVDEYGMGYLKYAKEALH